jgi:TorA maturation chaperone TorD
VELEFMQQVILREEQAWQDDDKKTALLCQENGKKFVGGHLARWVPNFCEKVIEAAESPFYREMAQLTRSFIELEKQELDKLNKNSDLDC